MNKVRSEIEERYLECDLTEEELLVYGRENANQIQQRSSLESEKKAYNSKIKSEIDAAMESIEKLSNMISTKKEYRHVDCRVIENYDDFTFKVIRLDTEETILERPMTKAERAKVDDLFLEEELQEDQDIQEESEEADSPECPYEVAEE